MKRINGGVLKRGVAIIGKFKPKPLYRCIYTHLYWKMTEKEEFEKVEENLRKIIIRNNQEDRE